MDHSCGVGLPDHVAERVILDVVGQHTDVIDDIAHDA